MFTDFIRRQGSRPWQALEVAERGIAGTEVIDGQLDPQFAQLVQGVQHALDVVEQLAFGQLQFQQVGRQAGLFEHSADPPKSGSTKSKAATIPGPTRIWTPAPKSGVSSASGLTKMA